MECYREINFRHDLAGFEKNQNTLLGRHQQRKVNSELGWTLSCRSQQSTSTPGAMLKNFRFPRIGNFCLEITGWANVPKAFIQVIDPETGQRLINSYQYLKVGNKPETVFVNLKISQSKNYNLAILFGGKETVSIGDTFWLSKIVLSNRPLTQQPTGSHNEEIIIRRSSDPIIPEFRWENPIKLENKETSETSKTIDFTNQGVCLKLLPGGQVVWEQLI